MQGASHFVQNGVRKVVPERIKYLGILVTLVRDVGRSSDLNSSGTVVHIFHQCFTLNGLYCLHCVPTSTDFKFLRQVLLHLQSKLNCNDVSVADE